MLSLITENYLDKDLELLKSSTQDDLDIVESEDSLQIIKKDFWSKILEFFTYKGKQARLERLRNYAEKINKLFNEYPSYFSSEQISTFYTQGLAKWDIQTFNRSALSEKIQTILVKELGEIRHLRSTRRESISPEKNNLELVEEARLQAILALKLGIKPRKNKGYNGSVIYLDIKSKPLGIFKEENTPLSIKAWLNKKIGNLLGFRMQEDLVSSNHQALAEIAASLGDHFFSIDLTPLTRYVELHGKKGSFMLWQHGLKEAVEFHRNEVPDHEELFLFQKMVIFDYFIGNLDRHLENWLVGVTKMNKMERIAMIDNGNAFPEEYPTESFGDYLARKNMYKWKTHPWAKYPFEERALALARSFTPGRIELYIDYLRTHLPSQGKEFLTPQRIKKMQERGNILRSIGLYSPKTLLEPRQLGEAYSSKKIEKFADDYRLAFSIL